jgi:hypothetical protein
MVLRWDEGVGCFCKSALISGGWRAVLCKMLPPLSLTFRSRSNVSHQSFHSLHQYLGFHLIRSLTNMPFYLLFRPLLYTMRSLALAHLRATPVNPLFDPNSKSRGRRQKKKKTALQQGPCSGTISTGAPEPPPPAPSPAGVGGSSYLAVAIVPPSCVCSESPRTPPLLHRRRPPLPASPPTWAAGAPRALPKTPVAAQIDLCSTARFPNLELDSPTSSTIPRPELYSPALYLDSVAAPPRRPSRASRARAPQRRRVRAVAPPWTKLQLSRVAPPSGARPPSRCHRAHLACRSSSASSPSAPSPEAPPPDLHC